jgi:hypothetical protein
MAALFRQGSTREKIDSVWKLTLEHGTGLATFAVSATFFMAHTVLLCQYRLNTNTLCNCCTLYTGYLQRPDGSDDTIEHLASKCKIVRSRGRGRASNLCTLQRRELPDSAVLAVKSSCRDSHASLEERHQTVLLLPIQGELSNTASRCNAERCYAIAPRLDSLRTSRLLMFKPE